MTNIMAKFMWCIARVDSRQYRQNSTELAPDSFWVGVEVPLTSEFVFNADEILSAQLGSGNVDVPKPVYTAKALQFCLDELGKYLHDPEPNDFKAEKEPEDWSDKTDKKPESKIETWLDEGEKQVAEIWKDEDNDDDPDDDIDKEEKFKDEEEDWS